MLYKVEDKNDFKKRNLDNWYINTDFWLEAKMRHLKDVYHFTGGILKESILELKRENRIHLLDLGCGDGWIFRLIKEKGIDAEYTGLDFNIKFIEVNKKKYEELGANFVLHDLESIPPDFLIDYADIAINFFNFFEIPDIALAFANVPNMIKREGILIIVNIDPIMQILSVSKDYGEFIKSLSDYEKYLSNLGYDKDIDIGDERSGRIYKSLLYSTDTYVSLAKRNGLQLYDYKEVVKTGNYVPQIYQYIFFKRCASQV
jgi:SAM-dependent methyltransferase